MNKNDSPKQDLPSDTASENEQVMSKIRAITSRGHNAEVRKSKDGSLTVMDVNKKIV